jgi:putative endonuclease
MMNKKPYFLYVCECSDDTLYTGITTDVERRIHEHNHTKRGAKYTRSRRPVRLLSSMEFPNRSQAARAEFKFKKLDAATKRGLVSFWNQPLFGTGAPLPLPSRAILREDAKVRVV